VNHVLRVSFFGGFSLSLGESRIDDRQNRSKKVWTLLAFLIYHHGRVVSQNELLDLLWSDDRDGANPGNALKTTLHRVRGLLDQLEPGAGHRMILSRNGGYRWNPDVELELDVEVFDRLCRTAPDGEEDDGLARRREALTLYRGSFLNKLSSDTWVLPISAYYHTLYIQTVQKTLEQMETHGMWQEAEQLCREALRLEPCQEDFYQHLMRNLLAMGQQKQAIAVYEEMSKLLLADFGIMPDQESRALYREALRTTNRSAVPAGILLEQLREADVVSGALVCDYDFFKIIYQAEARMVIRSGDAVHLALISLKGRKGAELPLRSLELAMDHMQEQIRISLRKGDVVSRCSPSQFVIMLPQANFENSGMVCQRILKAFYRQYPHSPAVIDYSIHPLEPAEKI